MTTSNIKTNIQCDIHKAWEIISAVERYHTWQSDVSRIVVINDKQFITYTKDGYSAMFTITMAEPCSRWEFDVENSHIKGHWTIVFASRGSETEVDITSCASAKQLLTRPMGKSVFEQTYLRKEQTQFIKDLERKTIRPGTCF